MKETCNNTQKQTQSNQTHSNTQAQNTQHRERHETIRSSSAQKLLLFNHTHISTSSFFRSSIIISGAEAHRKRMCQSGKGFCAFIVGHLLSRLRRLHLGRDVRPKRGIVFYNGSAKCAQKKQKKLMLAPRKKKHTNTTHIHSREINGAALLGRCLPSVHLATLVASVRMRDCRTIRQQFRRVRTQKLADRPTGFAIMCLQEEATKLGRPRDGHIERFAGLVAVLRCGHCVRQLVEGLSHGVSVTRRTDAEYEIIDANASRCAGAKGCCRYDEQ